MSKTIQERARMTASMISMGERISWGQDTELLMLMASRIDEQVTKLLEIAASRDEYQREADNMAAAHKVERDALKSENGSLRELMNTYNIGGWTDSLSLIEERGSLKKAGRFALDALEYHTAQTRPIERTQIAIEILKAVL